MITLFGIKFTYEAISSIVFFVLFTWSEYLGGNKKIESNNVASQIYKWLRLNRKEDDKLQQIIDILNKK